MKEIEELLKMTERPQDYSDEEIREMMNDPDMRAYYELMVSAEAGFAQRKPKSKGMTLWKIAAMFIGVLLLSGVAFAAWHFSGSDTEKAAGPSQSQESAVVIQKQEPAAPHAVRTFENAELQQILQELSDYYHVGVEFRNEQSRHIRLYTKWDTTAPLNQIIELLNGFEKVSLRLTNSQIVVE